MRRVTRSSRRSTIPVCDESVAVALPASRRCQSSSASRSLALPSSPRPLFAWDRIDRSLIRRGTWSVARSRTSGLTTSRRGDWLALFGREIRGRTDLSLHSTSTSVTCSSSQCSAGRRLRCGTRASQTLTRSTWCSCRHPRPSTRSRWPGEPSTCGKRRNSLRRRTHGESGSTPRSVSTARQSDLVWSRSR